jgi:hypothetical protein
MWLLNHAEDVLHAPVYKRSNHYGSEVQHVVFLVWNAANRICTKRLMPFLPTLLEALERHEHLHITENGLESPCFLSGGRKARASRRDCRFSVSSSE